MAAKPKKRKHRKWTDNEIQYMRENYGRVSPADVAAKLGRSVSAVHKKAMMLELTKREQGSKYTGPKAPKHKKADVVPGDRVQVTLPGIRGLKNTAGRGRGGKWAKRRYTGRVLQVHERYILVQLPAWKECVNVGTLISGEASIELLERRQAA